jgi:hypothetical protein
MIDLWPTPPLLALRRAVESEGVLVAIERGRRAR